MQVRHGWPSVISWHLCLERVNYLYKAELECSRYSPFLCFLLAAADFAVIFALTAQCFCITKSLQTMRDWRVLFYFHRQVKKIFFLAPHLNQPFHRDPEFIRDGVVTLQEWKWCKFCMQSILSLCISTGFARWPHARYYYSCHYVTICQSATIT